MTEIRNGPGAMSAPNLRSRQIFEDVIHAVSEAHRPSRMPFFGRLAALPHATASDPALLAGCSLTHRPKVRRRSEVR